MIKVRIFDDKSKLSVESAELVAEKLSYGLKKRKKLSLVLAGGSTPENLYQNLPEVTGKLKIDWSRIHVFFGDERCSKDHPERLNFTMASRSLLDKIDIPDQNIHRVNFELPYEKAALEYHHLLKSFFKINSGPFITLLGIGDDGHTASLFPSQTYSSSYTGQLSSSPLAVPVDTTGTPRVPRVSMTFDFLNRSRHVIFLATGSQKAGIISKILSSEEEIYPASRIKGKETTLWLIDESAGRFL